MAQKLTQRAEATSGQPSWLMHIVDPSGGGTSYKIQRKNIFGQDLEFDDNVNFGKIGINNFLSPLSQYGLDVISDDGNGFQVCLSTSGNSNTERSAGIAFRPYLVSNRIIPFMYGHTSSTESYITIGGGINTYGAITALYIYTASAVNTNIGSLRVFLSGAGTINTSASIDEHMRIGAQSVSGINPFVSFYNNFSNIGFIQANVDALYVSSNQALRIGTLSANELTLGTNGLIRLTMFSNGEIGYGGTTFGGATGNIICLGYVTVAPTTNPSTSFLLWSDVNGLWARGPSGTVTKIANP